MDSGEAASKCREIATRARSATLATLAKDPAGYPYASLVAVAWDGFGRPLLCISALAEHTKNLALRREASLLVVEPAADGTDPLSVGRVTMIGPCEPIAEEDRADARTRFLEAVPSSATYVDMRDFAWYRIEPVSLRYVGGFGRMTWIDGARYRAAK